MKVNSVEGRAGKGARSGCDAVEAGARLPALASKVSLASNAGWMLDGTAPSGLASPVDGSNSAP